MIYLLAILIAGLLFWLAVRAAPPGEEYVYDRWCRFDDSEYRKSAPTVWLM